MVETALRSFGDLHVVVNNAAIERNTGLTDLSEEDFDDVLAVKLKGTLAVTHWAARHWRDRFRAGSAPTVPSSTPLPDPGCSTRCPRRPPTRRVTPGSRR